MWPALEKKEGGGYKYQLFVYCYFFFGNDAPSLQVHILLQIFSHVKLLRFFLEADKFSCGILVS
jgi:hypothetical protein